MGHPDEGAAVSARWATYPYFTSNTSPLNISHAQVVARVAELTGGGVAPPITGYDAKPGEDNSTKDHVDSK